MRRFQYKNLQMARWHDGTKGVYKREYCNLRRRIV